MPFNVKLCHNTMFHGTNYVWFHSINLQAYLNSDININKIANNNVITLMTTFFMVVTFLLLSSHLQQYVAMHLLNMCMGTSYHGMLCHNNHIIDDHNVVNRVVSTST